MLPVVAIVGRPNVGKSTLFNALTRTRDAITADVPGVTRDRQYGYARIGAVPCVLIDTGGLIDKPSGITAQMRVQTEKAVAECDRIIFLADARAGLTAQDRQIAGELRRAGKPVTLAINKSEGLDGDMVAADFQVLGIGAPQSISAVHGQGCRELIDTVLEGLIAGPGPADDTSAIRVAIIGRPNVGKSTLVNRLLAEERVIAGAEPGTTRDSIMVPFQRDGRDFLLVDTAGGRRPSQSDETTRGATAARAPHARPEG